MAGLRDRLQWNEGRIADGPRRYLMMRPDVLMGALAPLPAATRYSVLQAWAAAAERYGGDSLRAYARSLGPGQEESLLQTTAEAAADLGWGRWSLRREGDVLQLQVHGSPFVAGWRAAVSGAPGAVDAFGTAPGAVCAPVQGLLAALAEAVLGAPVQATELHCAAQHGGESCRFEARRSA